VLEKALAVGFALALGEVINGNIRVRVLHRLYGQKRAKKLSFFSGTIFIYLIAWFAFPWLSLESYFDCFQVGFLWVVIMLCLDLYFGRYVFKFNWSKILGDFNPFKGNLIAIGMFLLFLSPSIVFWIRQ